MPDKLSELKKYFGHSSFRDGQEAAVDALICGSDVLAIMSTGAGKSLCYQLPALLREGTAIVISPLISLMKDQVNALREVGISAEYLNSSLTPEESKRILWELSLKRLKLIYIAPERLDSFDFTEIIKRIPISLVAVDEAHCVSQWGQDFRPHYLKIAEFIRLLPSRPPVGAFTATATSQVRDDIVRLLELRSPVITATGINRPNLKFEVIKPKSKPFELLKLLKTRRNCSGIVYCSTRKAVEKIWELLSSSGFKAAKYHAGMSDEQRRQNQEDFVYDRCSIMVATNAFGMGIDKSDIRFVIHYNMPKDPESYYQEAGRAGRDGSPADCILLYSPHDVMTARYLIEHGDQNSEKTPIEEEEKQRREYFRLSAMETYCNTSKCLRRYLLEYFGEKAPEYCGNCSNCEGQFDETDVTVEGQMILSCIIKTGQRYGMTTISDVLRGMPSAEKKGLGGQSTFGIMHKKSKEHITSVLALLKEKGYIYTELEAMPIVKASRSCIPLLKGEEKLVMKIPKKTEIAFGNTFAKLPRDKTGDVQPQYSRHRNMADSKISRDEANELSLKNLESSLYTRRDLAKMQEKEMSKQELLAALKELRLEISRREGVPPYIIFSDFSLLDMCRKMPKSREEFLGISGVGNFKLERFGDEFLAKIAEFIDYEPSEDSDYDITKYNLKSKKRHFQADMKKLELFRFSDEPITVSEIANRLNEIALDESSAIPPAAINYLLLKNEILIEEEHKSKTYKMPTIPGEELGIHAEWRISQSGLRYPVLLYGKPAQKFIVEAADELSEIASKRPRPWNKKRE